MQLLCARSSPYSTDAGPALTRLPPTRKLSIGNIAAEDTMRIQVVTAILLAMLSQLAIAGDDTPATIAQKSRQGRAEIKVQAADLDRLLTKMSNERFAAQVMEVSRQRDPAALASFINRSVPMRSPIEVTEIDLDWCVQIRAIKVGPVRIGDIRIGTTCKKA